MARHVLVTGFPGFIAKRLIDRLVRKDGAATFTFVVQEKLLGVAEASVAELAAAHRGLSKRVTLVTGDITEPFLGMGEDQYKTETGRTTHVWHLAAVYDLAVPEPIAYRVNVIGTANVLDFCEDSARLARLDYVSTCYVSGARTGVVREAELDEGQRFKNHYESTKAWAEMEVRRRMHRVPVCIHRPGIVVGDSRTGETDKYDGPYFIITMLMRMPDWMPMVNIGEGGSRVNLVPVNFLVDAMAELWLKEEAIGQTVQLADPNPHAAREIVEGLMSALGRRKPMGTVPPDVVEKALGLKAVRQLAKVPKESVIYFNHDVLYDTENQRRLLAGTGVSCPDLLSYLPTLVEYVKAHPDKQFLDGREF